jgi:hypothetical protein
MQPVTPFGFVDSVLQAKAAASMNDKFEKFTERARKVLSLAQEEAQRFNHNYIGTEHLLLGLVREGDGVAAKVLSNLGVELNKVRSAVEHIIGRGDRIVLGEIGLTPRAKKVIELAVDEARRLNHHYIGTEHLLLGLVREGEGIAAGVLESLGVNLERVRAATIQVLNQPGSGQEAMAEQVSGSGIRPRGSHSHAILHGGRPRLGLGPLGALVLVAGAATLGLAVADAAVAYAQGSLPASPQVAVVGALQLVWTAAVLMIMIVLCAEGQRTGYVLALVTGAFFGVLGPLGHPYNAVFFGQSQSAASGPLATLQLALAVAGGALAVAALLALIFQRQAVRLR